MGHSISLNWSLAHRARSSVLGRWVVLWLLVALAAGCANGIIDAPSDSLDPILEKNQDVDDSPRRPEFDDTRCSFDPDDPYEPRTRFVRGPWIGECHDTEKKRPVYELSGDEADRYQDTTGYFAIANVYHEGSFWYAFIPKNALQDAIFQLEYFPAVIPAGHTQLRLAYKAPVRLYGQSSWVRGKYQETYDLVLSVEAVTRRGDQYDLFRGAQEHFAVAYRVTTLDARYQSMITEQDHHVEQWRLEMTDEEKRNLLPFYAAVSDSSGLNFAYHTLFKNCTTELIETLDGVVAYSWHEQIKRFVVKVSEIYPNIVRVALIARGLLPRDQSTDLAPLEEDPTAGPTGRSPVQENG